MDIMDKLEGIQKHLREEIERTQRTLEENVKCKCYSNAARLEQKIETLNWCWSSIIFNHNFI